MTVKLTFIYLNENREITNIYSEKIVLSNGILERNKLIDYIRKYSIHHGVRYTPYSILKYEFNLKLKELEEFVSSTQGNKDMFAKPLQRLTETIASAKLPTARGFAAHTDNNIREANKAKTTQRAMLCTEGACSVKYSFSQIIRRIDTISFSNSNPLFASLNELWLLFYPKLQTTYGITKRIFITPSKNKTRRKIT